MKEDSPSNQWSENKSGCEVAYLEQTLNYYSGNKLKNASKTQLKHRQSL